MRDRVAIGDKMGKTISGADREVHALIPFSLSGDFFFTSSRLSLCCNSYWVSGWKATSLVTILTNWYQVYSYSYYFPYPCTDMFHSSCTVWTIPTWFLVDGKMCDCLWWWFFKCISMLFVPSNFTDIDLLYPLSCLLFLFCFSSLNTPLWVHIFPIYVEEIIPVFLQPTSFDINEITWETYKADPRVRITKFLIIYVDFSILTRLGLYTVLFYMFCNFRIRVLYVEDCV